MWSAVCWYDAAHARLRRRRSRAQPARPPPFNLFAPQTRYDVALVLRRPRQPLLRKLLLERSALPSAFCERLGRGWYPPWIDEPAPTDATLCCTHRVVNPRNGDVCHSFFNVSTESERERCTAIAAGTALSARKPERPAAKAAAMLKTLKEHVGRNVGGVTQSLVNYHRKPYLERGRGA